MSFSISPEKIWAKKEMIGLALILLLFVVLIFGFKSKQVTHKGIATVSSIGFTGTADEKRYNLKVQSIEGGPNIFQESVVPKSAKYRGVIGAKRGQRLAVFYKKGPDGKWMIWEIPPQ